MRGTPVLFQGFAKGVNLQAPPYELSDQEARDARNCIATGRGAAKKRNGNSTFAATAAAVDSLYAALTPALLIIQMGGTIATVNTGGAVANVATGLSSNRWEWASANISGGQGPFFGVNGSDTPRYVSGAGAGGTWTASTGSIPNGKFIKYINNRVIIAGDASNPSRVYGSKILDPRIFASPDGWAVDLDASDGLPITALGTLGPYILVFKEHKVWVIYDTDTGANRRLTDSIGCIAPRSVIETPSGTYWLAREGVFRTNGQHVDKEFSRRVQPMIDAIVPSNAPLACGALFGDHYYLSICTSGSANNYLLDYDLLLDAWWIHTVPASQLGVWRLSSGAMLMGGRPGLSRIDQFFVPGVLQDSGVNFDSYYSGPFHAFQSPYVRKRLRRIHFDGKGFINVSLATDFANAPVQVGQLSFTQAQSTDLFGGVNNFGGVGIFGGGAAGTLPKSVEEARVYTPGSAGSIVNGGTGRVFGLTFGNSTSDDWEVESYTMNIMTRKN